MAGFITFFLTAVVTFVNVGAVSDFAHRWMKSWSVAWPVASLIAFFSMPHIRRLTEWIVAVIERAT
jgi:xanthine/uracil/vitamin C permease (AzgA family)